MFGDPNLVKSKTRELVALRQTSSVSAYASEFRRLQAYIGWNDQAFFDQFYEGLRENVKDGLVHEHPSPEDLEQLMAASLRIDFRIYECLLERRSTSQSLHPRPSNPARPWNSIARSNYNSASSVPPIPTKPPLPTVPKLEGGPTPMELDFNRFPQLTLSQKQERLEHRRKNGLCTYCGSNQHLISNCPICPPRNSGRPPFAPRQIAVGYVDERFDLATPPDPLSMLDPSVSPASGAPPYSTNGQAQE